MVCHIKISDEKVVLTLGACVSLVCLFAVFFIYFGLNVPHLKRHTSTLIIRRCLFEIIFVSQYLWLAFVPNKFFWSDYSTEDDGDDDSFHCETNPHIWPLAWLTQFSLLGAELWFAALAVDIHVSLTNPFSSHREYDRYYRIFVYTLSSLMATILVSVSPIQYGVSTDPMIWVKDQTGQINWMKIGMFYMFIPFIYIYGAIVLVWARWQIHRGLEETLKMRKYSVSKLTRYVIGYFCFYVVLYSFQFFTYLKEDFNAYNVKEGVETGFRTFCAFLLASRGVWSLGIFVVSNWHELSMYFSQFAIASKSAKAEPSSAQQGDVLEPPKEEEELVQLNVALQKEIVRFTASGIRQALRAMESTDSSRTSSGRTSASGPFIIFQTKMPGDAHSFLVEDVDPRASFVEVSDVENPMVRDSLRRPSLRRTSLLNSPVSGENNLSVDQISYDMMPRPAPSRSTFASSRQPSNPGSQLSARILEGVRKLLAPRSSFQFTDFSPKRFAKIRWLSGISPEQYQQSFSSTTMPDFSGGRSGAFMYFSWDKRFIVKTCTAAELETLLSLLPDYEEYLTREHRRGRVSMLARYIGAHRIVMYDIPLYFVVMKNICPLRLDEKYDLKGSWISRHGSKKKKDPAMSRPKKKENHDNTPLFLDNDLQNSFLLRPEDSRRIARQLDRDTKFLQQFYLMDYSLLIGVKRRLFPLTGDSQKNLETLTAPVMEDLINGQVLHAAAVEGPGTFYIGLIDLLQQWTWMKWLEYCMKVYILQKDGLGVSSVEPHYYRQRFMQRAVVDVFDGIDGLPDALSDDERVGDEADDHHSGDVEEFDHADSIPRSSSSSLHISSPSAEESKA